MNKKMIGKGRGAYDPRKVMVISNQALQIFIIKKKQSDTLTFGNRYFNAKDHTH